MRNKSCGHGKETSNGAPRPAVMRAFPFIIHHSASFMSMTTRLFAGIATLALTRRRWPQDLTIGLGADVTSMDPHVLNARPTTRSASRCSIRWQARPSPALHSGPRRELARGGRHDVGVQAARGVKFHNGSDFTAEDVCVLARPALYAEGSSRAASRSSRRRYAKKSSSIRTRCG
jgi:hypothetical protein